MSTSSETYPVRLDMREWTALIGWLAISALAGVTGSFFMPGQWHEQLAKPDWNPPDWVFGPVWTTLYALMGIAAWLVWRRDGFRDGSVPLGLFLLQLSLNAAWTPIFFGAHEIGWALLDLGALWIVLVATVIAFFRVERLAGTLLLPYLAWVTFAFALNFSLWRLNGQ